MSNIGECSLITDETTDLRQGDIFYYTDKDENENYGIIITGDCDIDKNKCNNTISYCSIFTAKYHIQTKVLREKINKQLSPLKDKIFSEIKKNVLPDGVNDFNLDNVLILEESGLKKFLTESSNNEKISESILNEIKIYKELYNKEKYTFEDYAKVFRIMHGKDADISSLKKTIGNEKLAEDLFFINEIPQIDSKGFIVYLRYINTFPKDSFYRNDSGEKKIFRIAHLNPPYIHSLTQHVGAMFSDIGLSNEFEKNKETNMKNILDEIGAGK